MSVQRNCFGKALQELRIKRNMSQQELADAVGLSAGAISYYERGKREPSVDTIARMSEAMGYNLKWFLLTASKTA